MFVVRCDTCGTSYPVDPSDGRERVWCARCRRLFPIPREPAPGPDLPSEPAATPVAAPAPTPAAVTTTAPAPVVNATPLAVVPRQSSQRILSAAGVLAAAGAGLILVLTLGQVHLPRAQPPLLIPLPPEPAPVLPPPGPAPPPPGPAPVQLPPGPAPTPTPSVSEPPPAPAPPPAEAEPVPAARELLSDRLDRAQRLLDGGDPEGAERIYREALGSHPRHPGILAGLAACAVERRQLPEAQQLYERALAARPDHPAALMGLGRVNRLRGDVAEARRWYQTYLERHPDGARAGWARRHLSRLSLRTERKEPVGAD